jgi:carbon storage regulator CsrA
MLVLTRKSAEEIRIGNDITVKVIAIRGGQVKLGIDAPRGIRVSRVEHAGRTMIAPGGIPGRNAASLGSHQTDTPSTT